MHNSILLFLFFLIFSSSKATARNGNGDGNENRILSYEGVYRTILTKLNQVQQDMPYVCGSKGAGPGRVESFLLELRVEGLVMFILVYLDSW